MLDVLAVHRLVRLVTKDTITKDVRGRIIAKSYRSEPQRDFDWDKHVMLDDDPPKLADLVTCRWCASVWIAFGVVIVRRFKWWPFVRDALALSSASTLVARLESE